MDRRPFSKLVNFVLGEKGDSFTSILNITPHGTIRKENMHSWTGNFCKFFSRPGYLAKVVVLQHVTFNCAGNQTIKQKLSSQLK